MSTVARRTVSRRRFVQGISATAAAVGASVALGGGPVQAAASQRTTASPGLRQVSGTSLTFADVFEPKTYGNADGGVFSIREGIGQGLVQIDFNTQFVPALATDWTPVDPTTWRITLRPGVTFHNGVAMDAGAVVYNLQRLAESKDAVAAFRGASVTADDSMTVTIRTSAPVPFMPAVLADGKAVIYEPSASYAADGSLTTPVGTGPFRLAEYRLGDRRVLEAHSSYWGGTPGLGEVQYLFVPQAQTRANMLRTGAADVARVIAPADVAALKATSGVQVLTTGLPRVRLLWPQVQSAAMADVRVRRALAHAIDRQIIVDTVLENFGTVQAQIFRPDYPWGNPAITGLPFDQAAATTLLTEAGYSASSPLSFTLTTYASRSELAVVAQVLQQQWAEVGIQCELNVVADDTTMVGQAMRGETDMTMVARNPLFLFDAQANFESDYLTGGSYNLSRYTGLDDQIAEAGTIVDSTERYARYRQMEQQLVEQDVAVIVLNSYLQIDAAQTTVSGYQPHPTDAIAIHAGITKS